MNHPYEPTIEARTRTTVKAAAITTGAHASRGADGTAGGGAADVIGPDWPYARGPGDVRRRGRRRPGRRPPGNEARAGYQNASFNPSWICREVVTVDVMRPQVGATIGVPSALTPVNA